MSLIKSVCQVTTSVRSRSFDIGNRSMLSREENLLRDGRSLIVLQIMSCATWEMDLRHFFPNS